MILDLKQALIQRLERDPLLAQMLGQYDQRAAIFGFAPAPERTSFPCVVVDAAIDASIIPSKSPRHYEVIIPVTVWSQADGDPVVCEDPADYIWESFENEKLEMPGWSIWLLEATPATDVSNEDFYGRSVLLRIWLSREA